MSPGPKYIIPRCIYGLATLKLIELAPTYHMVGIEPHAKLAVALIRRYPAHTLVIDTHLTDITLVAGDGDIRRAPTTPY